MQEAKPKQPPPQAPRGTNNLQYLEVEMDCQEVSPISQPLIIVNPTLNIMVSHSPSHPDIP